MIITTRSRDSDLADAVKLLARAHQIAVWERTRQVLRLRSTLREYFPASVEAFEDLTAPDSLTLLARAPDPARAAKLTRGQLVAALRSARRHHVEAKADTLLAALRAPAWRQPATPQNAYAAVVIEQVDMITALNKQIAGLQAVTAAAVSLRPRDAPRLCARSANALRPSGARDSYGVPQIGSGQSLGERPVRAATPHV